MEILYKNDVKITTDQFVDILKRSELAERRPVDDPKRLTKMIQNADILVTAWDNDLLVGIGRAITDYAYCTYLSDIAVDVSYQRMGIGKKIMRMCKYAGIECFM